jgi:hypothetical protein
VPEVYRWLAQHGEGGPLLELPAQPFNLYGQSLLMYYSTYHWLPMVNGYTPYPPRTYVDIMNAAKALPAPEALPATLALAPVRWIILHRGAVPPRMWSQWDATLDGGLARVAEFGKDVLYEVRR